MSKTSFTTEEFVDSVIEEVSKATKIDASKIVTLSWSSSGPAAYAIALEGKSRIRGSYVAMSVYSPDYLPPVVNAKGRRFYLYHSPQDRVCRYEFTVTAKAQLAKAGVHVHLQTYEGGHGWTGPRYLNIREGLDWLLE